jgi:hypothetical protein
VISSRRIFGRIKLNFYNIIEVYYIKIYTYLYNKKMDNLISVYAIVITCLFVVYADYNKCKIKQKNDDEEYSPINDNICYSNKPIIAYGGSFTIGSSKSERYNSRANTI